MSDKKNKFILWFSEVNNSDVGLVGGKNASLGEMYQTLTKQGVNIPNGFAVTAYSYFYFLDKAGIRDKIKQQLSTLNVRDTQNLEKHGMLVRETILNAQFPPELSEAIVEAYTKLEGEYGTGVDVAVRSSATAEDLPDASFAGQQESFLNVRYAEPLLNYCKKCIASLFTNRAISYRETKGFDHFKVGLSIGVQKMVRSDEACSGVIFTLDTESGFDGIVLLTGSWGLGENIVQGAVNPDEFVVFKKTLSQGFKPIVQKKLGTKELRMIYNQGGITPTKNTHTPTDLRSIFCLSDEEVLTLARWAVIIEDHYSKRKGSACPMDIEWAKDGLSNKLFIVQARPETVHSQASKKVYSKFKLKGKGKVLVTGRSVGTKIASGPLRLIKDVSGIHTFREGEILVTTQTDPDWEPIMKKAKAIVTDRGGRTCHAAIISRELGIPCVVGCGNASVALKGIEKGTVDCSSGENGFVLEGLVDFEEEILNLDNVPRLKTKICMNLANPESAYELSSIPNDGVGLLRMEFIIASHIQAHPLALIHPEKNDSEINNKISQLISGYPNGHLFFVDKLAQGIGTICAAFYPKRVILRFSDFKTDEYANLLGGKPFEPLEDNPMIGWRGASRYYSPHYREGFAMECEAVLKVRKEYGLNNLAVMIPFCRTVEEAKKVVAEMALNKLKQHEEGLEIMGMCEIPSNVILAEQFLEVFDGYSIGSNDLTQLTLGIDRNSDIVAPLFDERNQAVKDLVIKCIKVCREKGKYVGICGQAPSDYPEFAEFLVREGIESMSLNPDTVIPTTLALHKVEQSLHK